MSREAAPVDDQTACSHYCLIVSSVSPTLPAQGVGVRSANHLQVQSRHLINMLPVYYLYFSSAADYLCNVSWLLTISRTQIKILLHTVLHTVVFILSQVFITGTVGPHLTQVTSPTVLGKLTKLSKYQQSSTN